MTHGLLQIGEVAERTGLSLRTIRYYEEVGLVVPAERSPGGFRLYRESDIARLELIKHMKPLEFSLEEMGQLLGLLDQLAEPGEQELPQLVERLAMFRAAANAKVTSLREQLATAEAFADRLRREVTRGRRRVAGQRR